MKKLTALLLIISSVAQAEVKHLGKGEVAPYEGYLFSLEDERKLRLTEEKLEFTFKKLDLLTQQNEGLQELNKINSEKAELYKKQADYLATQVAKERSDDFWKSTLYFALGAVLTGLVAYGVNKTIQ